MFCLQSYHPRLYRSGLFAIALGAVLCFSGCDTAPSPEPVDITAAVSELERLHAKVTEFAKGADVDGHAALHSVGNCLNSLKQLDGTSGLENKARAEITGDAEEMMAAYGEIDNAIHANEAFEFAKYEKTLNDALDAIKNAAAP